MISGRVRVKLYEHDSRRRDASLEGMGDKECTFVFLLPLYYRMARSIREAMQMDTLVFHIPSVSPRFPGAFECTKSSSELEVLNNQPDIFSLSHLSLFPSRKAANNFLYFT